VNGRDGVNGSGDRRGSSGSVGNGDESRALDGKPRAAHLGAIREMTGSELVDVRLLSVSSAERLIAEGLFEGDRDARLPAVPRR